MIALEVEDSKKTYRVEAECPQCGYDDVSFLDPEKWGEKFMGGGDRIDILCPLCGTRFTGNLDKARKAE